MKKVLILIVISILLFTACAKTDKADEPSTDNQQAEQKNTDEDETIMAPDFELEDLDGNKVKLSDYEGKKVIVNFWATWCIYCVQEMPDLVKLQDEYSEDLVVLFVNVGESKDTAEKFLDEKKMTGIILLDTNQRVAAAYGVRSFPSTLAINERREVVTGRVGMMPYETMVAMYQAIK